MENTINWREIQSRLAEPFDSEELQFRIQGNPQEAKFGDMKGKMVARCVVYVDARCVVYVDARCVQDRLDDVVGIEGWSFDWEPMGTKAAKGKLTIWGICKSDVGDGDGQETEKGRVSDSLKRAAVQWGIARYLYGIGDLFAECEQRGNTWYMKKGEEARLRVKVAGLMGQKERKAA
jgi:hypothetical protein